MSIVLAITGVAGPDPDEDDNPVSLLYPPCRAKAGRGISNVGMARVETGHLPSRDAPRTKLGGYLIKNV